MVTSFQSVAGGWHFSQGLLSPEVATQGIANLPPAPLPGAALGEMAHPPDPGGLRKRDRVVPLPTHAFRLLME